MFHNTPNGLQMDIESGWTISISLAGADVSEGCEIAVWPTGLGSQNYWVRWGANGVEPPDFPIYDKVLRLDSPEELIRVIDRLSSLEVESNKWISRGLSREAKWR